MLKKFESEALAWTRQRYLGLFVFNTILVVLSLLHTARYFNPVYEISINLIFFTGMALSIIFLGVRSRVMFFISLFFWVVAAFFQAIKINVWAERSGVYAFEAIVLGVGLLIFESGQHKLKSKMRPLLSQYRL